MLGPLRGGDFFDSHCIGGRGLVVFFDHMSRGIETSRTCFFESVLYRR